MVCEFCAMAKSKQKAIKKINTSPVEKPGERIYMDISSIQAVGLGGSRFWCLLVDESTKMKWSIFIKRKSDLGPRVIKFFKELKNNYSKTIKVIRCDNAGENMALATTCKREGLGINFEFTAPGTPQHNGVVERAFATLFGRVRAMMNEAKFPEGLRKDLWTECANTATDIDNLIVSDKISPYQAFHGVPSKIIKKLQIFGEMAVIKNHSVKFQSKLKDKGTIVMFLGYADNHSADVYRFLKMGTKRVVLSRDVIWLNKLYCHYKNSFKTNYQSYIDEFEEEVFDSVKESNEEESPKLTVPAMEQEGEERVVDDEEESTTEEDTEIVEVETIPRPSKKLSHEMRNLHTFYNPTLEDMGNSEHAEFLFLSTGNQVKEPETFNEAWFHDNPEEKIGWRDAIEKELSDMHLKQEIWDKVAIKDIPYGRKLIGSRWVFKRKKNGIYRARLCALGYNQVPGLDYTDNIAPVVNDITAKHVLV